MAENKMMKESLSGIGIVSAFIGGLAPFPINLALIGVGVSCVGMDFKEWIDKNNKYNKFFIKSGICDNDSLPILLSKNKREYGYMLEFTLPCGKGLSDFTKENRLEKLQQYLGVKRVEAEYKNKRMFFKVVEKEIDHTVPYEFVKTKHILEIPVGLRETDKSILIIKLDDKKPHILVGGEIGGGKSAWITQCLVNIIKNIMINKKYQNTIINVIDFKTIDYVEFYGCKYVKNIIHNLDEANKLFIYLIKEMRRRYKIINEFAQEHKIGTKHIDTYNEKSEVKMPYIITVIDEFADITNCIDKETRRVMVHNIHELCRLSRAAGIHLIIGLQRPDKDNLPGAIKSLLPARIGFRTSDAINSRIILDCEGAENLRGAGHGIYKYGESIEFQGMFIKEGEIYELIKESFEQDNNEMNFNDDNIVEAEWSVKSESIKKEQQGMIKL